MENILNYFKIIIVTLGLDLPKQTVDGIPGAVTLAGCPVVRKGAQGNIN